MRPVDGFGPGGGEFAASRSTGVPHFSRHAARRADDRAIPPLAVALVMAHGRAMRSHGAWRIALDKASRRRLRAATGKVAYERLKDLLDIYVVVSDDGVVVTTAWRTGGARRRRGDRLH